MLESLLDKITALKACKFIKKETPSQVFSCEYYKTFKISFIYGTPPVAAFENGWIISKNL